MPLYQDIKVGESYFDPEGFKVVVTGTHDTTCGERWLTYIRNPGTNLESNCSVPYGYLTSTCTALLQLNGRGSNSQKHARLTLFINEAKAMSAPSTIKNGIIRNF